MRGRFSICSERFVVAESQEFESVSQSDSDSKNSHIDNRATIAYNDDVIVYLVVWFWMANLKDVAKKAGVSTATVSRVLSGNYFVSDETKRKVISAVSELNYQPNGIARSLRNAKTQTIGVLVPDISNPYFMKVISALENYLATYEYNLLIASSNENPQKEDSLLKVLFEKRIDGLVLAPSRMEIKPSIQGYFHQKIPVVLIDRSVNDVAVDTVVEESENSAYELVKHVISMGHRDIAIINGRNALSTVIEREKGYIRALQDAGVSVRSEYMYRGEYNQQSGYSLGKRLLQMGSDRPTAVFCTNNFIALGVMTAANELKLQIPDDLSVVSFGDLLLPEFVTPRITSVIQSPEDVGIASAKLMVERIISDVHGNPEEIKLPTHIRLGESVRSLHLVNGK